MFPLMDELRRFYDMFLLVKSRRLMYHPPAVTWRNWWRRIGLPRKFCGACSLREGSAVVLAVNQTFFAFIAGIAWVLKIKLDRTITSWWAKWMIMDYSHWFGLKCVDVVKTGPTCDPPIDKLWHKIVDYLVLAIGIYEAIGFMLIFSLCCAKSHPAYLLPWIITTLLLILAYFSAAMFLVAMLFLNSGRRQTSVTNDMSPLVLIWTFGFVWLYGCIVVIALFRSKYRKFKEAKAARKRTEQGKVIAPQVNEAASGDKTVPGIKITATDEVDDGLAKLPKVVADYNYP